MLTSPFTWAVLVLAVGLPIILIAGVRLSDLAGISANRTTLVRLLLAGILFTGAFIYVLRFLFGIGPVTNLSDAFPWGLWISFDVMGGVARRSWARNPNAISVAAAYNRDNSNGDQITLPFLADDNAVDAAVDELFAK